MVLALLFGCAPAIDGTWMFEVAVTLPTGVECASTATHNFVGAYEPPEAQDDLSWTTSTAGEVSEEILFGRIEESGDAPVLILGTSVLAGTDKGKGAWSFSWTRSETSRTENQHATGYSYVQTVQDSALTTVAGSISAGVFDGTWTEESASTTQWVESDTWSDEAATYVGTTGAIPSGNYLLRLDSTGAEVPATNTQSAYDCGEAGCTLTVQQGCAYQYDVHGTRTDFEPEDGNWTEDAGQPPGI
jgi:hypothetical protein